MINEEVHKAYERIKEGIILTQRASYLELAAMQQILKLSPKYKKS